MPRPARQSFKERDAHHLSELVHRIYDASVHPERWCEVVAAIAASFDSLKGVLLTPYLAPQHGGVVFPVGIAEADLQLWGSTYIKQDLWAINAAKKGLFRTGAVHIDEDVGPRKEFLASAWYREFLSRQGIGRVCAGVVFEGSPGLPGMVLSVYRADRDPAFNQDDVQWMKLLVAHVSRAMGLMQRLDTARVQNASLLASFDRLNFGVALLNENMQVVHLNQAAQAVIRRGDGLLVNANQQLESWPGTGRSPSLSRWLMTARDAPMIEQEHFLEGCVVMRDHKNGDGGENAKHYSIQCAPVPAAGGWHAGNATSEAVRYVVFITDPSVVQLPSTDRLCSLYGLTRTQAQIAREFANGGTYQQVAQCSRISEETVRSHAKEIYAKTRVNRQADLVRLVLSLGQSGV